MSQYDWGNWRPGNSRAGSKAKNGDWLAYGFKKQGVRMPDIDPKLLDSVVKIIEEELSKGSAQTTFIKRVKNELGLEKQDAEVLICFGSALATEESNMNDYLESSVETVVWLGGGCCSVCDKNDGKVIPINQPFPSGHFLPPACSSCICTISPHVEY